VRSRVLSLYDELPPGFVYQPDFLSATEEEELLGHIEALEFSEVRMRGVVARRRVRQFGWHYSFETYQLTQGAELPPYLSALQARVAPLAGVAAAELSEALITEYQPGATIGWHRDAPMFGVVAGISLRAACTFKLRPAEGEQALALEMPPRSAYVLDGEARTRWQHSIPAVRALRYSVSFRTLRKAHATRTAV
jgi:DNA oxidative demethylase